MVKRPESQDSAKKSNFSYNWAILSGPRKSAKETLEQIRNDTGTENKKTVEKKDVYMGNDCTREYGDERAQREETVGQEPNGAASDMWARGWFAWGYSAGEEAPAEENDTVQESWLEWVSRYRIFGGSASDGNESSNHSTSDNISEASPSGTGGTVGWATYAGNWIKWPWKQEEERAEEDENVSDAQLFKIAKSAIESSKGNINYAFKTLWSEYTAENRIELSVSNTITETQPVRYILKKKPLYSSEVQELAFEGQNQVQPIGSSKVSTPSVSSQQQYFNVIPDIDENYRIITWKTRLRLVGQTIAFPKSTSEKHIYRRPPSKVEAEKVRSIKKVLVIGIHGFMPIKMVKAMIGQSTGSSSKFTEEAVAAVSDWLANTNEISKEEQEIHSIALEGEGKIEDRVRSSMELLKNWESLILSSDFIFVVSHSYGTPLAINFLAELLKSQNCCKNVGLLSMAGSFCGPLPGMDSKLVIRAYTAKENEIMNELFELQKPTSTVSLQLNASLQTLFDYNVKITLAGAINDHFIPLHSALATHIHHPNIYRFLYVDPSCELPPFITSLFKTVVILRNMGHHDYNLFNDLDDRCVGSVTESAHSKIYSHRPVYTTAIKHSLETTSLFHKRPLSATSTVHNPSPNLFNLPWNFRALINDLINVRNISNTTLLSELLQNYNTWVPITKPWRELKYCFNALEDLHPDDIFL